MWQRNRSLLGILPWRQRRRTRKLLLQQKKKWPKPGLLK
jgi:hypothetical protein